MHCSRHAAVRGIGDWQLLRRRLRLRRRSALDAQLVHAAAAVSAFAATAIASAAHTTAAHSSATITAAARAAAAVSVAATSEPPAAVLAIRVPVELAPVRGQVPSTA